MYNLLDGQAGTISTDVSIICVLLHRLGVIAGNHFNEAYSGTDRLFWYLSVTRPHQLALGGIFLSLSFIQFSATNCAMG